MSLLPPTPPRFGTPGQAAPQGDKDWLQLFKFFLNLCRYLVYLANSTKSTVSGSTSGNATFAQVFQGTSYSKVVIFCSNLTGTATYTFPSPFTFQPAVVTTDQVGVGVVTGITTFTVTLTGAATNGFLFLEGF